MPLTYAQLLLLQNYRDKSYISAILCEECSIFYSRIKSLVNIPLILSSSIMTILNSSSFSGDQMKVPNIVINGCSALLLAVISNFKLPEKVRNFKTVGIKHNKLCHAIEDELTNNLENSTADKIRAFINEYDNLNENLDYAYIDFIKIKIKKRYDGKKVLPNILNCNTSFVENSPTTPVISAV